MEKTTADIAVAHFVSGFNCSESLTLAMCERLGISSELIPMIASGLGGGIARCGHTCGAFTGAVMALGMKFGRMSATESREPAYSAVQELEKKFVDKFDSVNCSELLGFDLRTKEGHEAARASGVFDTKCKEFVRFAAATVDEIAGA